MSESTSPRWPGSKGGPGLEFAPHRTSAGGAITAPGNKKNQKKPVAKQAKPAQPQQPKQNVQAKQSQPGQAKQPAGDQSTQPGQPKQPKQPSQGQGSQPKQSVAVQQPQGKQEQDKRPGASSPTQTSAASAPEAKKKPETKPSPLQAERVAKAKQQWDATPVKTTQPDASSSTQGTAQQAKLSAGGEAPTVVRTPKAQADPLKQKRTVRRTRKARLRLARLDPWSVMKTTFLFSIAFGIMMWVVTAVLWSVLVGSGALESANSFVNQLLGDAENSFDVTTYISAQRVLGLAALIAVLDVLIITAVATLMAFLYNLAATVMGGLEVTLAED